MVFPPIDKISDLHFGGFYLPAVSYGYLSITSTLNQSITVPLYGTFTIDIHLALCIITLVAAVLWHKLLESFTGPAGVLQRPIATETAYQRMFFTIYNRGRPSYYPKGYSLSEIFDARLDKIKLAKRRALLFITVILLGVALIVSYPITTFLLYSTIPTEGIVPAVIAFMQGVWILQIVTDDWWPNLHTLEKRTRPALYNDIEEFVMFLYDFDVLGDFSYEFKTGEGGELKLSYETLAESPDDEIDLIGLILEAYSATLAKSSYPCRRLVVEVFNGDVRQGEFIVKTRDAQRFSTGELTFKEYLDSVISTIRCEDD